MPASSSMSRTRGSTAPSRETIRYVASTSCSTSWVAAATRPDIERATARATAGPPAAAPAASAAKSADTSASDPGVDLVAQALAAQVAAQVVAEELVQV